jgi:hypothetical protein
MTLAPPLSLMSQRLATIMADCWHAENFRQYAQSYKLGLQAWYMHGGFTDEYGIRHNSQWNLNISIYEVKFESFETTNKPKPCICRFLMRASSR